MSLFGQELRAVEHIGSTAIPGMLAYTDAKSEFVASVVSVA
jgi:GrpB-like predicted nucleotidyltransferase (UPF0157 family)